MSDVTSNELAPGHVTAAISNAVVRITREHLGRGPTRARTTIRDDIVLVVMEDTMTRAERTLAAAGRTEEVLRIRRVFQAAMREHVVAAVEELTGRTVEAFMSDNHIEPDLACEMFVLAPADGDDRSADQFDTRPLSA